MRGSGTVRARSRSPRYPLSKRIKLGSHSIGSPPLPPSARSPERIRNRSQSRDSRYRHSRAASRDRTRSSPRPPSERPLRHDPDSPRDEGEIREYDTPDRDRPPTDKQRPAISPFNIISAPQPSPGKHVVENDVKPKSPPPEVPVSASILPHTLPSTPPIPPKQPIRSSSPPKHPRNWSESRPTESSLFIPPSIRRGRGRGGGSYRGGMYRGGGPPDAPRAPRNRGIPQASTGQEHPQETTAIFCGADSAPSPPASTKSKTETPPRLPSAEPEETIEQLLKWVNEELIVTDMMQEERKIMDRSKLLRDEYLAAHKYTHELAMEHYKISNETHQALHEYEMANIELKHLQQRRQGLNKQQELARLGLLGMDYESDSIGTPV
ncbi:hypothetical protein F5890DRAFT_320657 [Lentinula detonsa]|uniref:Uncharacterized protein n=1 Tax=Lentinula detonsa TaxID=2804962 RepID=A0AA38UQ86_9AGAR|nr:hypothetical protein F5890DRAFT_320657 [Lentinula detonsa]